MSNFIFTKCKNSLLTGDINFLSDSIKVIAVNENYIPSENEDEFVSDIESSSIIFRSDSLSAKTISQGSLDASDLQISNYDGSSFYAIVMYVDTGNDATSRLISYIDTATGLPFEGVNAEANVTIIWNDDSNKIISL